MLTILMFLILIALTLNHPVHMVMLLIIFGSLASCVHRERKLRKNAILETHLLDAARDAAGQKNYHFLITYQDGSRAIARNVRAGSRGYAELLRYLA